MSETSSFGTTSRESHDSRRFYNRRLYHSFSVPKQNDNATVCQSIPDHVVNNILLRDSRDLSIIPDNSVHLMVTSPPYNTGKVYDDDLTLDEYLGLLRDVLREAYRTLVAGGRAAVNIANLGRKPYIPLHVYVIELMLDIGYVMRGEIIWDKGTVGGSCAWGTFQSAKNPVLRDQHEYILVFSKDCFDRADKRRGLTMSPDEFLEYTKSIWHMAPESAKRIGHPAPFPLELPMRLIKLYTFPGDVVLDPFCGSGTTCLAAKKLGRHYIGVDNNPAYCELAMERIRD